MLWARDTGPFSVLSVVPRFDHFFFFFFGVRVENLVIFEVWVTSICLLYLSFCFDKNCLHTLASQLPGLSCLNVCPCIMDSSVRGDNIFTGPRNADRRDSFYFPNTT